MALRQHRQAGFTLIELMIVVVILGILASIGLSNYVRMKQNAQRASCISNQRHASEQAIIYTMDTDQSGAVTFNINVLTAGNYLTQEVAECPESATPDFDDYSIDMNGFKVVGITCSIEPVRHQYTFVN